MTTLHPNNCPNEKCEGCFYYQSRFKFCNYPFDRTMELMYGAHLGTHQCTAYGNRYFRKRTENTTDTVSHLTSKQL